MKPIYPLSSYLYALSTHLLYTSFRLHHHIRFSTTTLLIKKSFAFTRVVFSGWMIDFRLSFPFKRYSIYFCRDAKIIKSKTIVDCYISPPRLLFALFPFPRRGAGSARCILNSPTALVFFKQKIRQSSARLLRLHKEYRVSQIGMYLIRHCTKFLRGKMYPDKKDTFQ